MKRTIHEDEDAQMLLATGMVLLMSLLSMVLLSLQYVSMGEPYDPSPREALRCSDEIQKQFPHLIEVRASELIQAGSDERSAIWAALNSSASDLNHHGEIRGIDVALLDSTVDNEGGAWRIQSSLGVADDTIRLEVPLSIIIDL